MGAFWVVVNLFSWMPPVLSVIFSTLLAVAVIYAVAMFVLRLILLIKEILLW